MSALATPVPDGVAASALGTLVALRRYRVTCAGKATRPNLQRDTATAWAAAYGPAAVVTEEPVSWGRGWVSNRAIPFNDGELRVWWLHPRCGDGEPRAIGLVSDLTEDQAIASVGWRTP